MTSDKPLVEDAIPNLVQSALSRFALVASTTRVADGFTTGRQLKRYRLQRMAVTAFVHEALLSVEKNTSPKDFGHRLSETRAALSRHFIVASHSDVGETQAVILGRVKASPPAVSP